MPVIFWGSLFQLTRSRTSKQIDPYHDGEGIPAEETAVYVRDDAYGKCAVRHLIVKRRGNR